LLSSAGIEARGRLRAFPAHDESRRAGDLVAAVARGERVALVTDAGMPGISDPGSVLVRACLDAGLAVEVVPGPSAVLTALVVSGLPTDRFVFEGFLPRSGRARAARLAEVAAERRTTVVFEAPPRVAATIADLTGACGPERPVAIARELTKKFEEVWRGTLGDAVVHTASTEPRGEYVLVVGGAPEVAREVDDDTIRAAVQAARATGLSARDAAAAAADRLGVPKRRAYQLSLDDGRPRPGRI
jgi:16S rRNA (cytidine1402-2'-O)-methyltransferase